MPTPRVALQEEIISWLRFRVVLFDGWQVEIRALVQACRTPGFRFDEAQKGWLVATGLRFPPSIPQWDVEADLIKIIVEQVDDSGEEIVVRDILGGPLVRDSRDCPRTGSWCQPGALKVGDILATGETVCFEPREGGNGSVLVKLYEEGDHTVWLSFPARTPLALFVPEGVG